MGWLKLCNGDPLVATLSDVFRANIIRVPEERMQPLSVLAASGDKLAYRGRLADLLTGTPIPERMTPSFETSGMADVSGKRSRKVKAELGLDILKGFLSGFGVSAAQGVAEQFSGASEVSFSFSEVQRVYIAPSRLGRLLAGRRFDLSNPVAASFVHDEAWECLVIDSVIASRDFTISIDRQASTDFSLDVPAIENLLAQASAKVEISSASSASLTFKGPKALAFAFSCQPLILDRTGSIRQMPPDGARRSFESAGAPAQVLISREPAMLDWVE